MAENAREVKAEEGRSLAIRCATRRRGGGGDSIVTSKGIMRAAGVGMALASPDSVTRHEPSRRTCTTTLRKESAAMSNAGIWQDAVRVVCASAGAAATMLQPRPARAARTARHRMARAP
jgi:hypothetical protein